MSAIRKKESPRNFIDLTGKKIGMIKVLSRDESVLSRVRWNCLCDCGAFFNSLSQSILSGKKKDCGCVRKMAIFKKLKERSNDKGLLLLKKTKQTYRCMISRCYKKSDKRYMDYGGRGIYVCERWLSSFSLFLEDMGVKEDGQSIDRIDNDGPYSKENCRWASSKTQSRNKRHTIKIGGIPLIDHCESIGIKYSTAYSRFIRNSKKGILDETGKYTKTSECWIN